MPPGGDMSIVIQAIDQASSVMRQIAGSVSGMSDSAQKSLGNISSYIEKNRQGIESLRNVSAIGFGAIAASVGVAVNRFGDFEKQMSEARAVLGLFGNDENVKNQYKELTDLAIKLGAESKFTAKEAADGITILGQAGFSTNEIMQSLKGTMDLAAATNISIADSADIASSVLRQYGIDVSETSRVMDVLAKTSIDSNASIMDLRESFNYFGPTAKVLGISLEESSAAIGIIANSGIKGSAATRALGTALTRLSNPTNKMRDAMDYLGFSAFDQQGKFIGLKGIIESLNKSTASLTQEQKAAALQAIFGADAFGEVNVLLNAGSDALGKFTDNLSLAGGTTDKMAKVQLDNMKGSLELMNGSLDSLMITLGGAFAPTVSSVAKAIVPIIDSIRGFIQENPELASTILTVIGVITGLVAVLTTLGLIIPAITTAVTFLWGSMLGPVLLVIAVVGLLYIAWKSNFLGIQDIVNSVVSWFMSYFMPTIMSIRDGVVSVFNRALSMIMSIVDIFIGIFTGDWELLSQGIQGVREGLWQAIVTIFSIVREQIKVLRDFVISYLSMAWINLWNGVKNFFVSIWNSIKSTYTSAVEGIASFFGGGGKALIEQGFNAMVGGLVAIMKGVINGVIDGFEFMVNSGIESINRLIEALNDVGGAVGISVSIPKIPRLQLPRFAFGGIVDGPNGIDRVPALLSPGELILNKAQQQNLAGQLQGGNGQTIYITFSPQIFGSKDGLAEEIMDSFMKQFRQHTRYESF